MRLTKLQLVNLDVDFKNMEVWHDPNSDEYNRFFRCHSKLVINSTWFTWESTLYKRFIEDIHE